MVCPRFQWRYLAVGLVALMAVSAVRAEDVKPSWPMPPGVKWAPVNGYPMAYVEAGQGVPIVFVHGAMNDYRAFPGVFEQLAAGHRVIAVSLRHSYPESWNGKGDDFTTEQHAADVAALIRTLGLGKVHLLGHSRGGGVVVEVAKKSPDVIRTLILEDGAIDMPVSDTPEAKAAAEFSRKLTASLLSDLATKGPDQAAAGFVEGLNGAGAWAKTPPLTKEAILANIVTMTADKPRPMTTCDDVRKFDFPVLMMTGADSPPKFAYFYDEMRKCKLFPATVVIPNAAHGMHRQNPEAFLRTTLAFIDQH